MATSLIDNFSYRGRHFLDSRQSADTLSALKEMPETEIPDGFRAYCKADGQWYEYNSANTSEATTGRWRAVTAGVDYNKSNVIAEDIVTLTGRESQAIFPRTSTHGVVDDNGKTLDSILYGGSNTTKVYKEFTREGYFIHYSTGVESSASNFSYLRLDCEPGETFDIHTQSGNNGRAWTFLDSAGGVVESFDGASGEVSERVTAPDGAAVLIVNCSAGGYSFFEVQRSPDTGDGDSLMSKIEQVSQQIDNKLIPVEEEIRTLVRRVDEIDISSLFAEGIYEYDTGVEASGQNMARIIADTSMKFRAGDILKRLTVRIRSVQPDNKTKTCVYIYDRDKQLMASQELEAITADGDTTFDLSSYGLTVPEDGYVAVKGVGYKNLANDNVFYDFNVGTYVPNYSYCFALTVARQVFNEKLMPPSMTDALDAAADLSAAVAEADRKATPEMKLLCFGNSFTLDAVSYVPYILSELAPDIRLTVGMCSIDACKMAQHAASFTGESQTLDTVSVTPKNYTFFKYTPGALKWLGYSDRTPQSIIEEDDWHIITFQQNGADAFKDYDTYIKPFIGKCHAKAAAWLGAPARFGWLLTHGAYSSDTGELKERWQGTAENARKVMLSTPTSVLFPYGTAVENLRTVLNCADTPGLLADNTHLQEGIGCLAAAYSVALVIMRECGVMPAVIGDRCRPDKAWCTLHDIPGAHYGNSNDVAGITDTNCWLTQAAAQASVDKPYDITENI